MAREVTWQHLPHGIYGVTWHGRVSQGVQVMSTIGRSVNCNNSTFEGKVDYMAHSFIIQFQILDLEFKIKVTVPLFP